VTDPPSAGPLEGMRTPPSLRVCGGFLVPFVFAHGVVVRPGLGAGVVQGRRHTGLDSVHVVCAHLNALQ
jgi:hypothetical protein